MAVTKKCNLQMRAYMGCEESLPMQGDLEGLPPLQIRFKTVANPIPEWAIGWGQWWRD